MKQYHFNFKAGLQFVLFLMFTTNIISQKFLVNSEWKLTFGNDTSQYLYKKATVKVDQYSNVYTLGSAITSTGHDFLLIKQNSSGDTLYLTQWGGDGDGEDIAMDMWVSNGDEYVYVVGGSIQDSTGADSLDAVIVAFDDTGSELWHTYVGGTNSYNDIYTSIATDGTGRLYAAGTIGTGSSSGYDFLINGFDLSGSELFFTTYDYANYDDVAVKVVFDGKLWVAGASQPNDSTWDYCLAAYDENGSYGGEYRNYAGTGVTHRPTDAVFSNNRFYVTGGVRTGGTDYDIKTICMDTALNVVWEQTWDGADGMNDISYSIKVNNDRDVFITGQVGLSNWTSNTITIKYDSLGNEIWSREYDGSDGTMSDKGLDLELNGDNVYITGYIKNGSEFNTMCYDTAGAIRWQRITKDAIPIPIDMAVDGDGDVIIAAPLLGALFTEKFSVLAISDSIISDTSGIPICKKNELIIKFNPQVIKTGYIDDKGKVFGKLSDFNADTTITKMEVKLGVTLKDIAMYKIFKRFTTKDSLSLTRLGDTIRIEEIWSTLVMIIPDTIDLREWRDSLMTLTNDIYYAEENAIAMLANIPNDTYYSMQENLKSSTYPNAHINAESAWDYETGRNFVRVGVYDSGIRWQHPDLTRGGASFNSSVAHNGYDYTIDQNLTSSMTNFDGVGHGTNVGGIIGARRNNNIGNAGIAGGNGNDTSGIELYNFKVFNDDGEAVLTDILDGVMEGGYWSLNSNNLGYGISIANHSYVWNPSFSGYSGTYHTSRKAFYYSWINGVTHFAARGNYPQHSSSWNEILYPACLFDDWVVTVGASGTNGNHKTAGNGNPFNSIDNNYWSMIGQPEIDCVAPGTSALIKTSLSNSIFLYEDFTGTSGATPHVSGTGALVLSHYNIPNQNPTTASGFQNLCADDIDHLVEVYSIELGPNIGFDGKTGWGRHDAGAIFDSIKNTEFDILHFRGDNPIAINATPYGYVNIEIDEPIFGFGYNVGGYTALKYLVEATYSYSLPIGYSLVDCWALKSHALGMRSSNLPLPNFPKYCEVVSCNDSTITMKTFVYNIQSPVPFSGWLIGLDTTNVLLPYALHLYSPSIGLDDIKDLDILVYPNPTDGLLNLRTPTGKKFEYMVMDIAGKICLQGTLNEYSNTLDLSSLSSAIYFIVFENAGIRKTFKIIKY